MTTDTIVPEVKDTPPVTPPAADASTVLTGDDKPAESVTADGEKDATKTGGEEADADGTKDSSLEAYADFTMPEGMTLNAEQIAQASPLFKELGLNQEQAQKLVDFQAAQVQAGQQGQMDAFNQQKTDWLDQARKDPEMGGDKFDENVGLAKEAMSKFGDKGLTTLLNDFGVGNHPEMIRFMAKVGRLTKEDVPDDQGNPASQPKDHVSILYPKKS